MTDPARFDLSNIAETVKSLLVIIGAVVTAFSFLGAAAWWALAPRIEPWMARLEKIDAIERDLAALRDSTLPRRRSFLEFFFLPTVSPLSVRPGDTIEITYLIRRNVDCPTTVQIRFWSFDRNSYDTASTRNVEAIRDAVTSTPRLWVLTMRVPDLEPGLWAYHPQIDGRAECEGLPSAIVPTAVFRVVA